MEKYIKLNKSSTDSQTEGYLILPLNNFTGSNPSADNKLLLYFVPMALNTRNSGVDNFEVELTITNNKHKEVLQDLTKEFATGEEIYIDFDNETSTFPSSNISAVDWTFSLKCTYDNGWHGSIQYIKILPRDFIADDVGRPVMIDDTGSDRWVESFSSQPMYASVPIPFGFEATQVTIYGSATSAVTVYEADINSKTVTSRGTGNIGTAIDITDVTSDATNYLLIELAQANGEEVYGGRVTIAPVYA